MIVNMINGIINAIVNLNSEFKKNHELKINDPNSNVRIGRSSSVSHIFEREIATLLSTQYKEYLFLVDYPITLLDKDSKNLTHTQNNKTIKVSTIYPDILVIKNISVKENKQGNFTKDNKNSEVVAIIDLKLDLGYVDLEYYRGCKNNNFQCRENNLRKSKKCSFNYITGAYSKAEKEINKSIGKLYATIPKSYKRISIVCTKQNSHNRHKEYEKIMTKLGYTVVFLLDKCHPNTLDDITEIIKDEINDKRETLTKIFKLD